MRLTEPTITEARCVWLSPSMSNNVDQLERRMVIFERKKKGS